MIQEISHLRKYDILKVKFDLISYNLVMEIIERWKQNDERHYVTLTPPHSVLTCHRDGKLYQATTEASMTLPDGVGIILAANLLGYPHNGRATGPTLMLKLCDWCRAARFRHFFYGGASGVAEALAERLTAQFPGLEVAGTCCPPFRDLSPAEDAEIVQRINEARPDIVWVGLGSPKQEKWMLQHLGRMQATAMIGVGAAFDFHSGNVKWTPAWTRRLGLEWAYRLTQNPRRMWRRNLDSPVFLSKVIWQRIKMTLGHGDETPG